MKLELDDPKLTAYALGELPEAERAEVEAALEGNPAARALVDEIRATADTLTHELAGEAGPGLTSAGKAAIMGASVPLASGRRDAGGTITALPPRKIFWSPAALAASVLLMGSIGLAVWQVNTQKQPERAIVVHKVNDLSQKIGDFPEGEELTVRYKNAVEHDLAVKPNPAPSTVLALTADPSAPPAAGTAPAAGRIHYYVEVDGLKRNEQLGAAPDQYNRQQAGKTKGATADRGRTLMRRLSEQTRQLSLKAKLGDYAETIKPDGTREGKTVEELNELTDLPADFDGAEDFGTETYNPIVENAFKRVMQDPLSTFSIDVDTAAYSNIRRFLKQQNQLPPQDAIRLEEMVNYFSYNYPNPTNDDPFSVNLEIAQCPWNPEHRLARVGLKGKDVDISQRPKSNLVFLIDVSGSMDETNKLPLVTAGLKLMVDKLTADDMVSITVYAGAAGLVLPPTPGDQKAKIIGALDDLRAGGSTNGGQGIHLAYKVAADNFIKGGINRVMLCTDGDWNVGVTGQGDLVRLVQDKAKSGVFLTVLGYGMGNVKDAMMEQIADKGNGAYAFIDDIKEANKVLVEQMSGTLQTIAKDVKLQLEFNPAVVSGYRLVGYENRVMAHEDFNNDKKDAGDIGAGHTVTALYELIPVDKKNDVTLVDPLKYQVPSSTTPAADSGEVMTVKLRYKQPDGDKSKLIEVAAKDSGTKYGKASKEFKFAAAVASFGLLLRGSEYKGNATFDSVIELAAEVKDTDKSGRGAEFVELVQKARELTAAKKQK